MSDTDTTNPTNDTAPMRLRSEPPRVTRLSRKMLASVAAVALIGIGGALIYALQTRTGGGDGKELYSTSNRQPADGLAGLPRDYTGPRLGPPLPGDLGRPILDAQNRPMYLLGISEDITEERARSAELYLAKERAEKASRAKSDFLLNMSHEMRTPLNAILGFGRVLRRTTKGRLGEDEQAHLGDIVAAGEHMLQLINDLLDLRSLEALGLEVRQVELLPPLHEAFRMIQPLANERAQQLVMDVAPDLPPCLGERRAIVQVFVNLMTNATKFTPMGGKIEVRAHSEAGVVRLEVADTGCGIAPQDQAKLFSYFEQLGAKHEHHMKGSGLGLALTRALVEKMGGSISVASTVGEGTTFEVRLRSAA